MRLRFFKRVKHAAQSLGMEDLANQLYRRLGLHSLRHRLKSRKDEMFQKKYGDINRFCVSVRDQDLVFSTEEEFPKRLLFPQFEGGKIFEESVTNLLLDMLQDDSCFVDVGCNFGWYSCVVAKSATNRTVFAFDLDDSNVRLTEKNVQLNGCSNVSIHHCAVSDSVGKIQYRRRQGQAADTFQIEHNLSSQQASDEDVVEVDAITLDFFFRDRSQIPTVVKIDVQGAEFMVLEGMRDILRLKKPMLLVEIHPLELPKFGKASSDVFELLKTYGYRFFEVPGLRQHNARGKLREINTAIPLKATTMVLATAQQESGHDQRQAQVAVGQKNGES